MSLAKKIVIWWAYGKRPKCAYDELIFGVVRGNSITVKNPELFHAFAIPTTYDSLREIIAITLKMADQGRSELHIVFCGTNVFGGLQN